MAEVQRMHPASNASLKKEIRWLRSNACTPKNKLAAGYPQRDLRLPIFTLTTDYLFKTSFLVITSPLLVISLAK